MMDDADDREDRGTGRTRALAARADTEQALDLAAIKATLAAADRAAAIWRGLGSIAATIAIAIAGWALALAQQAAVDHVRVDRLEAQERAAADRGDRLLEAQTRTIAQLEQLQQTVADLRQDVRDLRGDERRNEDGGRR